MKSENSLDINILNILKNFLVTKVHLTTFLYKGEKAYEFVTTEDLLTWRRAVSHNRARPATSGTAKYRELNFNLWIT